MTTNQTALKPKKIGWLRTKSKARTPNGFYWMWYLLPALGIYVVFMAYPLFDSVRLSVFRKETVNRATTEHFVGFDNYIRLFTDPEISTRFWGAFFNTCQFFITHLLVQNVLGILFAALLTNQFMKGRKIYQAIIFIPTTFAILVTGYLWRLLLNPTWSEAFTNGVLGIGKLPPILGLEGPALVADSLVSCWQWVGIPTIIFVAAMRNINEDLLEAAYIEGASGWQIFWNIKLPLVKPVVGLVAILTFVNNFNAFDIIYAMQTANGAPNYSTDLLGTFFYRQGIAGQHPVAIPDPGLGAAIATVVFVLLATVSVIVLRKTETRD